MTTLRIIIIIANIPLYFGLGWLIFNDREGFFESLKYTLTPDIVSLFRGEYSRDYWASMKFTIWVVACGFCVFFEIQGIEKLFGVGQSEPQYEDYENYEDEEYEDEYEDEQDYNYYEGDTDNRFTFTRPVHA